MRKKPRRFDIFNITFLDVIACGFGAVILLVLISNTADAPSFDETDIAAKLLRQTFQEEALVDDLTKQLSKEANALRSKIAQLKLLRDRTQVAANSLSAKDVVARKNRGDIEGLALVQSSLKRASLSKKTTNKRDDEVGGIPLGSDYVIFIVDTSGSMKEIWHRVTTEIENVIRIHPKIKGFQILNDNGVPIISAYEGKWISDTPRRRQSVIELLRSWNSASNSSPVEGLEVALRRYAKPNISLSIYIFGDEYSGSSYDPVITALVNLNINRRTRKKLAKVHAVGFISSHSTGRFATLMREITRLNDGTFLALPN
jgi:hypothetical protein